MVTGSAPDHLVEFQKFLNIRLCLNSLKFRYIQKNLNIPMMLLLLPLHCIRKIQKFLLLNNH